MPVAAGSLRNISHVKEGTIGVDPGGAYQTDRFLAGARLWNDVDDWTSEELRSDRAVAAGVLGARHAKGTFPFELSYASFDDWIESAMCNAWVAPAAANTGVTTTVVAGTTNTMAGTGIGSNIAIGDWVKIAGFTGAYVGNNGFWRCTAVSANLLTFGEAKDATGASRLTAASTQAGISSQAMGYIVVGSTEKSLSVEFANSDITAWQRARGFQVNRMNLSIAQNAKITGSFEGLGYELPTPAAVKYAASYTAAGVTVPMTSYNSKSFLFADAVSGITGVPLAIVTAFDIGLDNGMAEFLPIFQSSLNDILLGRSSLSGSLTLGFTSATYLGYMLANTHIALRSQIMDAAGTSGYAIDIPNIRLKAPSEQVTENQIFHTYPWQAEKDATATTLAAGVVNCKISKLA